MAYELRNYQQEALDVLKNTTETAPLVVLPTGSGKSLLIAAYVKWLVQQGRKVVVATHVKELVQQNADAAASLGVEVAVFCAGLGRRELGNVIFGTAQSLHKLDLRDFVLIVDEAHRVGLKAKAYGELCKKAERRVGFTATPYRLDNTPFVVPGAPNTSFSNIVYEISHKRLIDEGFLVPFQVRVPQIENLANIKRRMAEYDQQDLDRILTAEAAVKYQVTTLLPYLPLYKKILVFGVSVKHTSMLAKGLIENKIKAAVLAGTDSNADRAQTIEKFKSGELSVLVNCEILTTGFNVPEIDCVVLLRPTLSRTLYEQMIGRGSRCSPNKTECQLLDFGGNLFRFGLPGNIVLEDPDTFKPCEFVKICSNWTKDLDSGWCTDCTPQAEIRARELKQRRELKIQDLKLECRSRNDMWVAELEAITSRAHLSNAGNWCIKLVYKTYCGSCVSMYLPLTGRPYQEKKNRALLKELFETEFLDVPFDNNESTAKKLNRLINREIKRGWCVDTVLITVNSAGYDQIKHL